MLRKDCKEKVNIVMFCKNTTNSCCLKSKLSLIFSMFQILASKRRMFPHLFNANPSLPGMQPQPQDPVRTFCLLLSGFFLCEFPCSFRLSVSVYLFTILSIHQLVTFDKLQPYQEDDEDDDPTIWTASKSKSVLQFHGNERTMNIVSALFI